MIDSYLTINGYILNVHIPEIIKKSIMLDEYSDSLEEDNEVVKLYNDPDIRMVDIMGKNFYREEYLESKPQIVLGPMDWKCYN